MSHIALKVDVDTWQGTHTGVPALVALLTRLNIPATFLFSLGPDHTGRALRRVLRPGFLKKVQRTSVLRHYGLRTLLYGTLLPGPDIGRREADTMRSVEAAGFEAGIHTWDHVAWQDRVENASDAWTCAQMDRAAERFVEIFGHAPVIHGAAGWQMNAAAFRCESTLGVTVASDTRGSSPFVPVDGHGHRLGPTQYPTTLPTMDELLGVAGCDARNVDRHVMSAAATGGEPHVYTLHAELEGQQLLGSFERLLQGWQAEGRTFVTLGRLPEVLKGIVVPPCTVARGTVPGRSGTLAMQGPPWRGEG